MLGMQCPAARGMKVIQRGPETATSNVMNIKSRRTAVKVQAVVAGAQGSGMTGRNRTQTVVWVRIGTKKTHDHVTEEFHDLA